MLHEKNVVLMFFIVSFIFVIINIILASKEVLILRINVVIGTNLYLVFLLIKYKVKKRRIIISL